MSELALADETAADIPVRDITLNLNGAGIPVLEKGKNLIKALLLFASITHCAESQNNSRWVWVKALSQKTLTLHALLKKQTNNKKNSDGF